MLQAINPKMLRDITVSGFRDGKLEAESWATHEALTL